MIEIQLDKGQVAFVDDRDIYLLLYTWSVSLAAGYAKESYIANGTVEFGRTKVSDSMHRIVMMLTLKRRLKPGEHVDHINGNTLDNRRENLRVVTRSQNMMNQGKHRRNKSGYKGVHLNKYGSYVAQIAKDGKNYYLGSFKTAEEAYEAYCEAAKEKHGEYARLK